MIKKFSIVACLVMLLSVNAVYAFNVGETVYVSPGDGFKHYVKASVEDINNNQLRISVTQTCWWAKKHGLFGPTDLYCETAGAGKYRVGGYYWISSGSAYSYPPRD